MTCRRIASSWVSRAHWSARRTKAQFFRFRHLRETQTLPHGKEMDLYADAGYQGIESVVSMMRCISMLQYDWQGAGKLNMSDSLEAIYDQIERLRRVFGPRSNIRFAFSGGSSVT